MASVATHYETLHAPAYLWRAGGLEHASAPGSTDLVDVLHRGTLAVDLGAGFRMHAIPLGRAGLRVSTIDTSALLIDQLRSFAVYLNDRAVVGDLLEFSRLLLQGRKADVIICMGDTLTHLPAEGDVDRLALQVGESLAPGGRFLATFRDCTHLSEGAARLVPVRSDPTGYRPALSKSMRIMCSSTTYSTGGMGSVVR